MAASLAEEQGRKQTAAPLPEQPEPELRRRFARSLLLPKVRSLLRLAVLQRCGPALQEPDDDAARLWRMAGRGLCSVGPVSLSGWLQGVCVARDGCGRLPCSLRARGLAARCLRRRCGLSSLPCWSLNDSTATSGDGANDLYHPCCIPHS
jgi:hypothetical protein